MEKNANKTVLVLASILLAVAVFNFFVVFETVSGIESKKEDAKQIAEDAEKAAEELSRPADISLIAIQDESCEDCFNISRLVSAVKTLSANIVSETSLNYQSDEAEALIKKYEIKKIPALIISGEVDKSNVKNQLSQLGDVIESAVVFSNPSPVYINLSDRSAVGRVSATIISADSCTECRNLSEVVTSLKFGGVSIVSETRHNYASEEAEAIISQYNITMVPAILFSKELSAYEGIVSSWGEIVTVETDGSYVIRMPLPPYINTYTGKTEGLVSLTNIVDASCTECYNVSAHKGALLTYGILPFNEVTYDIVSSEGKALIAKYNITLVPTIILSKEAGTYPQFADVWSTVGTIDRDGSYVFNDVSLMGTYRDLIQNKTFTD